ncbi:MAG TPA: cytochrome P450 [Polyangia bacterium]|nr:cytochrome P450 [Polyangia bacterium]
MTDLPAGPRGGVFAALGVLRDPYGALARYAKAHGNPFTLSLPPQGTIVVTADPAAIRSVFAADPETFGSSATKAMGPILGPGSVLILEGAAHRRARKLLNPPFHGDRMRAHGRLIQDITRERIARLQPGDRVSAQDLAQAISLEMILQAIFGVRGTERLARFDRAVRDLMATLGPFVAFELFRRSWGGLGPWDRFLRRRAELAALVAEEVAARRAGGPAREDILSLLLAARDEDGKPMSDAEIFDELLTLVAAGHETTMIAIAWALYWLHRTPAALARLREELDGVPPDPDPDALARLPYLDAVLAETLRLYPVVPLVTRKLARSFEIKGHALPAGVTVGLATSLVHYDPALYPEPQRFRPERFQERTLGPAEYFPFGGGTRRCLGAAFALYEIKIALATLLSALRLRPRDDRAVRPAMRAAGVGQARAVELVVTARADRA